MLVFRGYRSRKQRQCSANVAYGIELGKIKFFAKLHKVSELKTSHRFKKCPELRFTGIQFFKYRLAMYLCFRLSLSRSEGGSQFIPKPEEARV